MKITPETYEKMNEEFIRKGEAFRIRVPTQKEIDKWRSQSSNPLKYLDEHGQPINRQRKTDSDHHTTE